MELEKLENEVFEALSSPIRRQIIELLHDRVELSHKELMDYLSVSSGLLNHHLRKLSSLVEKTEKGTYKLSPAGAIAYKLLLEAREELGHKPRLVPGPAPPPVDPGLAVRRFVASVIDVAAIFAATGTVFDPQLWATVGFIVTHLPSILLNHPWLLHSEDLVVLGEAFTRLVAAYSHVFFAIYILLTLMEAYKGQTLGKYLMGLRVVKRSGRRLDLVESGIRNAGKLFLLPIDLLLGLATLRKGYLRYTDYYVDAVVVRVDR